MNRPPFPGDPDRLGDYEVLGRLGEGGMGTVFQGRSPDGRLVAIKVVRREFAADDEFVGRFRSEVNRARQVPPFSTAEVLDADPDHDPPYLVVEYVDGPSLAKVVREKGPLRGASLHGVAVGIATALTAIHSAGVIHRDLKPANVLMALGGVKVIDFGIARPLEMTSQHTRTDQMVGTVSYMAPERFDTDNGQPAGFPADIFAWGAVVYFAATGRTPFAADSAPATAMRILTQPPSLTGLDGSLLPIVERALAKDPAARPTARQLLDMLLATQTAPTPILPAVPPPPDPAPALVPAPVPAPRPRRRWRAWAGALVAAVLLAGGGLFVSHAANSGDPEAAGDSTPSTRPEPVAEQTGLPAILNGRRRTLLHMANIDRDLALPQNAAAKPGGGTTPESVFLLVPIGDGYQIQSMVANLDGYLRCLVVEPSERSASSSLMPGDCAVSPESLFKLSPTDHQDEKNRPTYLLSSERYGLVQWSESDRRVYVELAGDFPAAVEFSFVDRGPE